MRDKIYSLVSDLVRDGYVLVLAIAAPLSIAFTLAKAFDVTALGHLREISYAWALAPLVVWISIAYVRRWARSSALQDRLTPKVRCSFDMADPGCRRPNTKILRRLVPSMNPIEISCDWLRVRVDSDYADNITGCRGRLIYVKRDGALVLSGETPILPFAPAANDDAIAKTLYPGIPEFVDFMYVTELGQVGLTPHEFFGSTSIDWQNLFSQTGVYEIRIAVLAAQGAPAFVSVRFDWTGEFSTSTLSAVL